MHEELQGMCCACVCVTPRHNTILVLSAVVLLFQFLVHHVTRGKRLGQRDAHTNVRASNANCV